MRFEIDDDEWTVVHINPRSNTVMLESVSNGDTRDVTISDLIDENK